MGVSSRTVDVWVIRCLFNRAGYSERIQNGDFSEKPGKRRHVTPDPNNPRLRPADAVVSQEVYYYLGNVQYARIHRFLKADGSLAGSGLLDPKEVFVGGVNYTRHKGSGWWNEVRREPEKALPCLWLPSCWPRKVYGAWRRKKCQWLGR
jgi:hypothetical protein